MENNHPNRELEELIRESLKITDIPSVELNNRIKIDLYKQEALMRKQKPMHAISLWYVPMILNLLMFLLLGVVSILMIPNPIVSIFVAVICGYMAMAGIAITIIGMRRTNMKENITIYVKKRGAAA